MNNRETTLLLDVGGQGCRALVLDRRGQVLFDDSCQVHSQEDEQRVEQDADELAEALDALVIAAGEAMSRESNRIGLVGLAVQRGSVTCWHRQTGRALAPAISWRDQRGLPGMTSLASQAGTIKHRTGLRFSPYGGASKLAWCLANLSAVRSARDERTLALGPLGAFLASRLTGNSEALVDDTLAQRTLLWSRETLDWDAWLLDRFGLPPTALPRVLPSRSDFGRLQSLPGHPPLTLLVGDQNAVPFIDGQPDPDTLYVNLGTGAFLLRPLRQPVETEQFQLTLLDRANGGRWALEGSVHGAASAIAWLEEVTDDSIPHQQYRGLRQRVNNPPLFLNSIDGLGSPWWQAGPKPGFREPSPDDGDAGDRDPNDRDRQLLAVLESMAFLIRANVEAMNLLVDPPQRVVLSGGLSQINDLCRLIADVLGRDVQRLDRVEATAFGMWGLIFQRALPASELSVIKHHPDQALEDRYHQWRRLIDDSLAG